MELKNYMEDVAKDRLDKILKTKEHDVCQCDRCRADIVAYALNHLPSKYVVTRWGHIYTEIDKLAGQFKADIIVELTKAIKKIAANPRHER